MIPVKACVRSLLAPALVQAASLMLPPSPVSAETAALDCGNMAGYQKGSPRPAFKGSLATALRTWLRCRPTITPGARRATLPRTLSLPFALSSCAHSRTELGLHVRSQGESGNVCARETGQATQKNHALASSNGSCIQSKLKGMISLHGLGSHAISRSGRTAPPGSVQSTVLRERCEHVRAAFTDVPPMIKNLRWIACALLCLSACGGQADGWLDESDSGAVEGRSEALALYGREIHIDACDWEDNTGDGVCMQTYPNQGRKCVFDSQGRPVHDLYRVITTSGSSLTWGESTIFHTPPSEPRPASDGTGPVMHCRQSDGLQMFTVRSGDSVIARIPGNYDNVVEGPVRGTVKFQPWFSVPGPSGTERDIAAGSYVLAIQTGADGVWTDVAKERLGAMTIKSGLQSFTLDVSARVKPNTPVRLEFRAAGRDARGVFTSVYSMRLFSPTCIIHANGDGCL